jgi:membrane associated rhomboid family serine protease
MVIDEVELHQMTPWVLRLIIANAVVYVLSMARPELLNTFDFVPVYILARPWTLITYMFLHIGIAHILFNMIALFFFGPRLEAELGGRRFLWLYFISGITGAVLSFVFNPLTPIVGASGAIYGVMLGFAYFWPRERLLIWGIFPIEARLMVILMTALSLFGGFGGAADGIAHFAHLGGFAGGFLYLQWLDRTSRAAKFRAKFNTPSPRSADVQRWMSIRREDLHEVNRAELDRIMAKLAATGPSSLTEQERAFLNRFSA